MSDPSRRTVQARKLGRLRVVAVRWPSASTAHAAPDVRFASSVRPRAREPLVCGVTPGRAVPTTTAAIGPGGFEIGTGKGGRGGREDLPD